MNTIRTIIPTALWTALLLAAAPVARADEPQVIPLWEKGAPGFENLRDEPEQAQDYWVRHINNPTLTVFPSAKEQANGAGVLIIPGGGFREVVYDAEGVEPAHYLNHLGVTCFVLKYRLPRETNSPYSLEIHPRQDGQRAMRLIRTRAAEWNLDPKRIGVLGFSAGCEVEAFLVYSPTEGNPEAVDPIERMNCRSDFQMVIYPGPLGVPAGPIPADVPPAFFLVADDDLSHVGPVLAELQKYHEVKRPVEIHIYERGGHGFNLGARSKYVSIKNWPQRMADWMADNGLLRKPATSESKN
ncbi:MAG TPA: alpha/beta hydrolase [Candidatus Acidoferrales bacterium]|nr:alpha/beta hydrolase [Candidatus Acidoferrales bacterium]